MQALLDKVIADGSATLDIFLEVNDIYSELLDGHLAINSQLNTSGMLDGNYLIIVSGEVVNGSASAVQLDVAFPTDDGEFVLNVNTIMNDGSATTKQITQIDGKPPLEFYAELSSQSPFLSAHKVSDKGSHSRIPYLLLECCPVCMSTFQLQHSNK